jgi:hypothetical protein
LFIPVVNPDSHQDTDNHNENLHDHIQQVLAEFIVSEEALTDLAEEAEHWLLLITPAKYEKAARIVKLYILQFERVWLEEVF